MGIVFLPLANVHIFFSMASFFILNLRAARFFEGTIGTQFASWVGFEGDFRVEEVGNQGGEMLLETVEKVRREQVLPVPTDREQWCIESAKGLNA